MNATFIPSHAHQTGFLQVVDEYRDVLSLRIRMQEFQESHTLSLNKDILGRILKADAHEALKLWKKFRHDETKLEYRNFMGSSISCFKRRRFRQMVTSKIKVWYTDKYYAEIKTHFEEFHFSRELVDLILEFLKINDL